MLEALDRKHAEALLAFELENRAYFARSIPDRGDGFFRLFDEGLDAALAEQSAGICRLHVLTDADGAVLGRFNLYEIRDGAAELGYRMAERACGRGLATGTVLSLCDIAAAEYGLRRLSARASDSNPASQRVLVKAGFVASGSVQLNGRDATVYTRELGGDGVAAPPGPLAQRRPAGH